MTISHTWTINSLEYADTVGFTKAVNRIVWSCSSDDGDGHVWNSDGSKILGAPNPNTFAAFDTLTQDDVTAWLGAAYIAAKEAVAGAAIQKLIIAEASNAGAGVPW
jgi:hypothetical protein